MCERIQIKAKNLLDDYSPIPDRRKIDQWIDEIESELETQEIGLLYQGYTLQKDGAVSISFRAFTSYSFQDALSIDFSRVLFNRFSISKVRVYGIEDERIIVFEVPYNKSYSVLGLKSLLTEEWLNDKDGKFTLPIGMGSEPFYHDIARMPHLAICGATGSGKSVFIHSLLISLAIKYTPEEVKFLLCDPKMVEYTQYEGLPHLYTGVVTTKPAFIDVLEKINGELINRFDTLSDAGCWNIDDYNKKAKEQGDKPFAKIIVVIDELLDFIYYDMQTERMLSSILKRCRAAGIHLIASSQNFGDSSSNILDCFSCRVAFKMRNMEECRNFIESVAPLSFNNRGELAFVDGASKEELLQCPYVSIKEIDKIMTLLKETY